LNEIRNKVAESGLITLDMKSFVGVQEREIIDISQWLHQGQILKEKLFRKFLSDENWVKYQIIPKEKKSISGMNWLKSYMMKSDYEFFPEKIVFSKELEIAGTIDILALDKKTNKYDLIDWKTSKKIEMNSYGGKVGTKIATNNIPDCNYYHYTLQLSLYRYLLERSYGLKIRTMIIAHLKEDYARAIEVPYMKNEILEMLDQ